MRGRRLLRPPLRRGHWYHPMIRFQNKRGNEAQNHPHPAVCIVRHASQEGGLVLEISDTKALQSRYPPSANRSRSIRTGLVCLPHKFRLVTPGHVELADIGNNDESPSEYTFVSSLCTLHKFSTEDDIQ